MPAERSVTHFACENGHPVARGSTVCLACGGSVTARAVKAPRASARPRSRTLTGALALVAAALVAAVVAWQVNAHDSAQPPGGPGPGSAFLTACGGSASVEIQLDRQYDDASPLTCFTVTEEVTITIGATSISGIDLKLEVENADGAFWAAADDTYGTDPEISTIFLPGSYVISVTRFGGSDPGSFTLLTTTSPSPYSSTGPSAGFDDTAPSISSCGVDDVAWMNGAGQVTVTDGSRFACVLIPQDSFMTVGAIGEAGHPADLTVAVYRFDDAGNPVFVHSADNTFGLDPEFSVDVVVGMYLLEVAEKTGQPIGTATVYVDDTPSEFRTGAVSGDNADFSKDQCGDEIPTELSIGEQAVFDGGERVRVCLTLTSQQRLTIAVSSQVNQDLVLEVIGFGSAGAVRYAWNDDDLFSALPSDVNPVLDLMLPAGTYVLEVDEFGGAQLAHDATITVSTSP